MPIKPIADDTTDHMLVVMLKRFENLFKKLGKQPHVVVNESHKGPGCDIYSGISLNGGAAWLSEVTTLKRQGGGHG